MREGTSGRLRIAQPSELSQIPDNQNEMRIFFLSQIGNTIRRRPLCRRPRPGPPGDRGLAPCSGGTLPGVGDRGQRVIAPSPRWRFARPGSPPPARDDSGRWYVVRRCSENHLHYPTSPPLEEVGAWDTVRCPRARRPVVGRVAMEAI